jgi:hypothetical protein
VKVRTQGQAGKSVVDDKTRQDKTKQASAIWHGKISLGLGFRIRDLGKVWFIV